MTPRSRWIAAVAVAFVAALIAALIAGSSDDKPQTTTNSVAGTTRPEESASDDQDSIQPGAKARPANSTAAKDERKATGPKREKQAAQEGPSGPAPSTDPEQQASDAVDGLLVALDSGDGEKACAAFAPGALDGIKFPKRGSGCPATVEASLGYRDPRGLPVWKSSKPTGDISAQISGDRARVTATIVTDYADQRDPSVEDDVLYLRRSGNRWLLLKPSATFYRAIGIADVPLDAFKPPSR